MLTTACGSPCYVAPEVRSNFPVYQIPENHSQLVTSEKTREVEG